MSLFFRNLRRRLLANRKFNKYLFYALGEVLIIIIGILVAVQINNWNEKQHDEVIEIVILKTIKTDLKTDHSAYVHDLDVHEQQIESSQIIIEHLEHNKPYHDSLARHFLETCNYTVTAINSGGYETLKSLGVGLVSNTELRKEIIFLYDVQYSFLFEMAKDLQDNFNYGEKYIFNTRFVEAENYNMRLGDHLEAVEVHGSMIPLDFEKLKNDNEYKYYLRTTKNKHILYLGILNEIMGNISQLISSIEQELQSPKT